MRKRLLHILPVVICMLTGAVHANWQYPGTYVGDGAYTDDGSRFVISVRGGASMGFGSIENKIGALTGHYYESPDGVLYTELFCGGPEGCAAKGYTYLGYGELGDLPATKDYESFAFAAGASIGWTIPNRPQWRVELGWDHISESEYNASPMFEGDLTLSGGAVEGAVVNVPCGAVQSKLTTDIISAMAFYDFFDGLQKPMRTMIPYVGFGVGYADTKTKLNLTDLYGELSYDLSMREFGEPNAAAENVLNFYHSETSTSNIAGIIALGVSYGITDTMYLDLGARVAYIPRIKFALQNADKTREKDWFDAQNVIYANIMLGLRFEF